MIFLRKHRLAFFHMMKCGGTSIVEWLREIDLNHQTITKEAYHEPLSNKVAALGNEFSDTHVFTLLRNPYAIPVSFYTFWRQFPREHSGDTIIAHDQDFTSFLQWYLQIARQKRLDGPYHPKHYLMVDGRLPSNLNILRLENCAEEIPRFLASHDITLRYQRYFSNMSKRDHPISSYYNEYLARQVYNAFNWSFQIGGYEFESWRNL
jgi:hypothetical protein